VACAKKKTLLKSPVTGARDQRVRPCAAPPFYLGGPNTVSPAGEANETAFRWLCFAPQILERHF